jgi:TolA-binding protein
MTRPFITCAATGLMLWLFLGLFPPPTAGQMADEEALYTIAVRAYQDGLLDLAREQLQTYLATFPQGRHRADVHYLLGDYFYRRGDVAPATRHLQEALQHQLSPHLRDDARYLLGRSFVEVARYGEAVQALRPLLEQGRSGRWYEAALYWTGEAQLSLGDVAGAARRLTELVERFPTGAYVENALYSLGYAWQKTGEHERGLQAFQRLLQAFPHSPLRRSAEYGVARALVALQRFAEAAPYWERLHQQAESPERAEEAAFWRAVSWTRAERCDQAAPAFQSYLARFPQGLHRADALITLAECALAAGDLLEASQHVAAFLQSFPADPRRESLLLRLADAYDQAGQVAPAIERYSQWLAAFPYHPQRGDILLRRGLLYHMQADYGRAVRDFSDALSQTSAPQQQALAHRLLAESYWHLDDCAAALPHFAAVIAGGTDAERRLARWRRGMCAYRNRQLAAAVEDFSRLVDDAAFGGDRQGLLLLLGQSLAALDRDAEAVARLRQLLASEPSDEVLPQALATLGASLFKIGQAAQALPVYEQLLNAVPDLAGRERLHLQLARLYREQPAPERAKTHLEAAAQGQDAAIAAEALYLLADLLVEGGAPSDAMALLQKLTAGDGLPQRWVGIAHYRLALLYEEAQQWPEAWQAYQAAASAATDPKLAEAARGRAQHLKETVDVQTRRESTAVGSEPQPTPDGKAAQ